MAEAVAEIHLSLPVFLIYFVICTFGSSWPDLFRPSTSLGRAATKDVDARDKRGHDEQ
jgi:hypothetical protein